MKLSEDLLYKTYSYFNSLVFGNELPYVNIKVYSSKVNQGYFEGYPDDKGNPVLNIKISNRYNKTYNDFCETLLHEMVHCFQYIKHMDVDHGKVFNKIAKIIKKEIGLNII